MIAGKPGSQEEGRERGERQTGTQDRRCRETGMLCNSNGQIVIAERFDRWIMTSNDTPRWESKPPRLSPLAACPMQPPSLSPLLVPLSPSPLFYLSRVSSPCAASLPHGGADVDMRLRHAYAAAFGIGLRAANHRCET